MSTPKNLCFFSARCRYSQNFLEELAKTPPYAKEFRFISVDAQNGQRPTLPSYVKAVPTLMIEGESKPRTDSEVMNWLSERRLKDKGAAQPQDGLMAFSMEMAVSGDESYSFLGEAADATKNTMVRMVGTMAGINDLAGLGTPHDRLNADAAMTQGAGIGVPAQSEKAKALDDRLKAYQQMRDMDNKGPRRV